MFIRAANLLEGDRIIGPVSGFVGLPIALVIDTGSTIRIFRKGESLTSTPLVLPADRIVRIAGD